MSHRWRLFAAVLLTPPWAACRSTTPSPTSAPATPSAAATTATPSSLASTAPATTPGSDQGVRHDTPSSQPEIGPAIDAAEVLSKFTTQWTDWSKKGFAGDASLRPVLDELVNRRQGQPTPKQEACSAVAGRLEAGAHDVIFGDPKKLQTNGDRCWTLHFDGLMGPGLGVALSLDGQMRVAWVVLEG